MPARKIQNEQEIERWHAQGRTYDWMVTEYARKYRLEMTVSAFSNLARRRGWERRIARDDDLIPWEVEREHRWSFAIRMLRFEGRVRGGLPLSEQDAQTLATWKRNLRQRDEVVSYDPTRGFEYVRKQPSDDDLIRRPQHKTTRRLSSER